ncbi:Two pore potassium channel [Seminavis robusta]|uniref:Two pore potassium channel n=1 Tax=Seminavis robusta TaxID=568900 RepID=A0A9N8DWH7_9STRA|nr:Two pore potassium channel [Seminavis robusta]|eukprot:Sro326_g117990.1 Two pore potassium channel (624) ;mRNA; f:10513-12471
MHYIPPQDDVDEREDHGSKGSKRSRGSRGSRDSSKKSKSRSAALPVPPPPPRNKSTQQKAAKKLRNLITRTFAARHPNEQDSLLTEIHCEQQSLQDSVLSTPKSSTIGGINVPNIDTTQTASVVSHADEKWDKVRNAVDAGEVLLLAQTHGKTTALDHNANNLLPHSYDNNNTWEEPSQRFYDTMTPTERQERREQVQKEIQAQMSFSLWHCVLAIVLYVVMSVVFFSLILEKEWTLLEAAYFAVVTFTTIGYGDFVPDTLRARIFTCFWALSGVASLGIALGVLGHNLLLGQEEKTKTARVKRQSQVMAEFRWDHDDDDDANNSITSPQSAHTFSTIEEGKRREMFDDILNDDYDDESDQGESCCWQQCTSWLCSARLLRNIALCAFFSGILYWMALYEGWGAFTAIYYGIITASTVGYGDFCPETDEGRILALIFIPGAVGIMGLLLDFVANSIIDWKRKQCKAILEEQPFTLEDLQILDGNGDGEVHLAEYLEFVLVAINAVDQELMEEVKQAFYRLDVKGDGTINRGDLAIMAKQRLRGRNLREKKQMAEYKASLLQKAHQPSPNVSPVTSTEASIMRPLPLERKTTKQTSNKTSSSTNSSPMSPPYFPSPYQNNRGGY